MIDYVLKSKVLNSGLCEIERDISRSLFFNYNSSLSFKKAKELSLFYLNTCPIEYKQAQLINHASYKRTKRLRDRISNMIEQQDCLFLTLTFTDDVLSSTNSLTRRRYITRFLDSLCVPDFVANIDFGKRKGREHYHAVIQSDFIDYSSYSYGSLNGKVIKCSDLDAERVSKYINKLTNHAIKETTKRCAIIYKRK